MWKYQGAVNIKLSSRSSAPPCPGNSRLVSLTPRSRLIADIVMSPKKPRTAKTLPIRRLGHRVSGVKIGARRMNATVVLANPPTAPYQVLLGLIFGLI